MIRHVTPDGRADGSCTRAAPCRLSFALSIVGSGDAVLIAGGDYAILTDTAQDLMRPDITVRGGYLDTQGFMAAAPIIRPSYVAGPPFEQRQALAARGLTLVHDRKALAISRAIDARLASREDTVRRFTPCDPVAGMAGPFPCMGIDLLVHVPLDAFSSQPVSGNDVWGFVDNRDNREMLSSGFPMAPRLSR